jgi:hypothetical protein
MKMVSVYSLYTLNTLKAHESENLGITDIERDSGVTSADDPQRTLFSSRHTSNDRCASN